MKKLVFLCLSLLASATFAHATITINLGGGNLYTTNTSTFAPTGSLVQLLASTTDTTFAPPLAGNFTGDSLDDVVLASFSLNENLGGPGTFAQVVNFALACIPNLNAGDSLLLRWFPSLSGTAPPSGPATGNMYGQFRIDIAQDFSDIGWFVPADGALVALNFLTMAQGSTVNPETAGLANMIVLIPEPSTVALLGLSVVGLAAYSRRRKV